jgi:hypothetical protein
MGNEIKPFTDFKGDVEQLSQEFMGRIEKAKPGKKFMGNEIKPFTDFKGDVEQLSQEFMGRIEKAKPGKKFTKKPRSISHKA